MRNIFGIRRAEWLPAILYMAIILFFQYLIVSKFWCLFADFNAESFPRFMRNFHMSGFDPITYDVVTHWHEGYDLLRHPLLAIAMYPLFLLNQGLWALTGCNCVQLIIGALLTFCALYSTVFVHRTMTEVTGIGHAHATLLTLMFISFGFVMVTMIVPDHFCLSMLCLTMTVYLAGKKINAGQAFTVKETIAIYMLTSGVTLSNGAVVLMIVLIVNGRRFFRWPFLLKAVITPTLFLLTAVAVQKKLSPELQENKGTMIEQQMHWTRGDVPKLKVLHENFVGESLQLHRKHILGDVLRDRPVIVDYSWKAQNYVVILLEWLFVFGLFMGTNRRFGLVISAVLAFNIALHIIMAFAIDEVYIMAAHWAFTVPLATANIFHVRKRWLRWSMAVVIVLLTAYLLAYHSYLLHRYLTWPLAR